MPTEQPIKTTSLSETPILIGFTLPTTFDSWATRRSVFAARAHEFLAEPATASIGEAMLTLLSGIDAAIETGDVERAVVIASYLGAVQKAGQLGPRVLRDIVNAPAVAKENKRKTGKRKKDEERNNLAQKRKVRANELWLGVAPRVEKGEITRVRAYREISEIMYAERRLQFRDPGPEKPKPPRPSTVRRYINPETFGIG